MSLKTTRFLSPAVTAALGGVLTSIVVGLYAEGAPSPQVRGTAGERKVATRPATRPAPAATSPSTAPAVPQDPVVRLDMMHRMALGLKLSAEQKAKVEALYTRHRPAMQAAAKAGPEKVRATANEWTKGLMLVLDEPQQNAFMDKLNAAGLVRLRPPRQAAGRAAEFDAWMERFDAYVPVSDEQAQQIVQALKDYTAATERAVPEAATPEQANARLDQLKVELMEKIEALLPPEERARLRGGAQK